jgi:hypothetical protein
MWFTCLECMGRFYFQASYKHDILFCPLCGTRTDYEDWGSPGETEDTEVEDFDKDDDDEFEE